MQTLSAAPAAVYGSASDLDFPDESFAPSHLVRALEAEKSRTGAVRAEVHAGAQNTVVPTRHFVRAASVWLGMSFLLCYVAIPLMMDGAGIRTAYLARVLPGELIGMSIASCWALSRVLRKGWSGSLPLALPQLAASDRIQAAALGGLMSWGLLHNILPGLLPMSRMSLAFLVFFGFANVLENVLFGTVLGTIAGSRRQAFALGAIFQLVLLSIAWIL